MSASTPDLQSHLERFGLASFRPGQQDVIEAVLAGRDCLCIMPTGGGKSLCYQFPAVVRGGLTLVVSPLIALMKDQVDAMTSLGIGATFVNSSLSPAEQRDRMQQLAAGAYDLLYVAPERFRSPAFFDAIRHTQIDLLAIDEAHCVSEWGHDFRPDYARLGQFRKRLGFPQTIALTATATPTVRDDVVEILQLREPKTFITGFGRPNLHFQVEQPSGGRAKEESLLQFLAATPGCGIIYTATRKRCQELVEFLHINCQRKVGLYHGGLMPDDRRKVQDEFMSGRLPIIVATNAFGMGIDKADLRFVVHYNMPGSLEAYYQEAGRAGRDGLDSRCMLLFSVSDRYVQEFFIENSYPSRETVEAVYNYLRSLDEDPIEVTLQDLKERLQLSLGAEGVGACERLLEKCGALERMDSQQNMAAVKIDSDLPTLVDLLPREATTRRKVMRAVEQLVGELRFEWAYIHPQQIAAKTELGRDAVSRAMRSLTDLSCFDFVPPFRGRAIHMLKRDTPFHELPIDFAELERRRAAEYQKLERVIRFARTRGCRQLEILEYFGDPNCCDCGSCDNCVARGGGPAVLGLPSGSAVSSGNGVQIPKPLVETVRIALSGVARTKSRFGREVIAQMLYGSKSSKITKWHLDQLSTYGLLNKLKLAEISSLLDGLMEAKLVEQSDVDRYRPVLRLTEYGNQVMRGEAELTGTLPLPPELVFKIAGVPVNSTGREALDDLPEMHPHPEAMRRLRNWRRDQAASDGAPPYRILTNAALDLVSRGMPKTLTALGHIKGVGPVTIANHGDTILRLLHEGSPPPAPRQTPSPPAPSPTPKPATRPSTPERRFDPPAAEDTYAGPPAGPLFERPRTPSSAASVPASRSEQASSSASNRGPASVPPMDLNQLLAEDFDDEEEHVSPPARAAAAPVEASHEASHEATARVEPPESSGEEEEASSPAEAEASSPAASESSSADKPAAGTSKLQPPPHYWTWRLLSGGFTLFECQQIRQLDQQEVYAHMVKAANSGLRVDLGWLFSDSDLRLLAHYVSQGDQAEIDAGPYEAYQWECYRQLRRL
ncbi:ATP-dependent DNA helicase RecQ [Lignipirellula cremea]|uniref:ATP-dependent DNA helicase RecQ n=2 Tax=Lignipirellula cremea TaxID=2528010 RepID=A0A518DT76_9BACT|nr:ATP-dependent DNA helicase RecQ [Lignipirellula cremea]